MRSKKLVTIIVLLLVMTIPYQLGRQAERSGVGATQLDYRDHYYPGTEELSPNEMRVSALGTGMPNARMSQAGSCWLVELGNGDKFFFDLGTGCMEKFSVLPPWVPPFHPEVARERFSEEEPAPSRVDPGAGHALRPVCDVEGKIDKRTIPFDLEWDGNGVRRHKLR